MTTGTPPFDAWLAAANNSHRRLAGVVAPLSAEQVAGPSYASEWSIAQVLSHLGSGAEIFTLFLRTGIRGEPAPGADEFAPVFEHWNAKQNSRCSSRSQWLIDSRLPYLWGR